MVASSAQTPCSSPSPSPPRHLLKVITTSTQGKHIETTVDGRYTESETGVMHSFWGQASQAGQGAISVGTRRTAPKCLPIAPPLGLHSLALELVLGLGHCISRKTPFKNKDMPKKANLIYIQERICFSHGKTRLRKC